MDDKSNNSNDTANNNENSKTNEVMHHATKIRHGKTVMSYVKKYFQLCVGAVIAATGLELFLIPNNVIDGGVVGLAIMSAHITGLPFGLFLIVINIPFLYLGYKQIGKSFALSTIVAVCFLSFWSEIFEPMEKVIGDPFLAAIFGGIIDGLGVGLIKTLDSDVNHLRNDIVSEERIHRLIPTEEQTCAGQDEQINKHQHLTGTED